MATPTIGDEALQILVDQHIRSVAEHVVFLERENASLARRCAELRSRARQAERERDWQATRLAERELVDDIRHIRDTRKQD